ncbi:hypothetical protein [Peribacillus deserti]|uniref:hypothetical protein n=1 Tax=Peribacillus deserti TaxID=673318 RepID=UPI0015E08134|nr:hypothetical protein [Peribacillus deserti]
MPDEKKPEQQGFSDNLQEEENNRQQNESEPVLIIGQGDPNLSPDAGRPLI